MPFDWNDYFTLAAELAQSKDNEAKMRSAVSRSYYCAFNLAKAYLNSKNVSYSAYDHQRFWEEFMEIEGKLEIKTYGERVRLMRNKVDYDSHIGNLPELLKIAMMNAQSIIKALNKVDSDKVKA